MFANRRILWYDSGRCEREREDLYEDLQQSKIKKNIYKNTDKYYR
jgi:hypothetical protein